MMEYQLIHDSTELRRLIAENPDLPIVVLAGEEAGSECAWTYCASVKAYLSRILDVKTPFDDDERVFDDEGDFEDAVTDWVANNFEYILLDYSGQTEEEKIKAEIEKYKPFWRDVIAIYATN